jgi:AraC-like DNA-binding protein
LPAGSYLVESRSTRSPAPRERAGFTDALHGSAAPRRTGAYRLTRFRPPEPEYGRTDRQIRQRPDADDDYRLLVPIDAGITLRQHGREARLAPGTGALLTFGAPFRCVQDPAGWAYVLTIPARELDDPLNRRPPLATALDLTQGLGRVLRSMLDELHEERHTLTAPEFDAVADRIVELLCMLTSAEERPDTPNPLAGVETVVRRHIRAHAADPALTGTSVARALGWSLRQIQLALQHAGTTPRDLIREERLRMVRDRLRCGHCEHLTITELAHATGFSSASAMSTAFRRRFGVSPREMRHESR